MGRFEAEGATGGISHIKFNSTASAPTSARKNNSRYEKTRGSEREEEEEEEEDEK